jgi:hypothetical protein
MLAARKHLEALRAYEVVTGQRRSGCELLVYRCTHCGFLHVGHATITGSAS